MPRKLAAMVLAALVCTTCASLTAQGEDTHAGTAIELGDPGGDDQITEVLDRFGVCGLIHLAVLELGPRTAEGALDGEFMAYEESGPSSSSLLMPAPDGLGFAVPGGSPLALELDELRGRLHAATLYWNTEHEPSSPIFDEIVARMADALGEPGTETGADPEWSDGIRRVAARRADDGSFVALRISCMATEEPFRAAMDEWERAQIDEVSNQTDDGGPDGLPSNLRLDRSIVDVILSFGLPVDKPTVVNDSTVGLHYRDFMSGSMVPTECWWWFVDGQAVYVATELLPPRGSNMARSAYQSFKNTLQEVFGTPTEESPLVAGGERRVVYQKGSQHLVMELLDVDGDPWFRLEIYDATRRDALPSELRPNRSLPERFTPPSAADDPDSRGLGRDERAG